MEPQQEDIHALYQAKQYDAIVAILLPRRSEQHQSINEWDGFYFAQALRKTQQSQQGLEVARDIHTRYPEFEPIRNVLGTCARSERRGA